jgi:hypothetical protein
VRFDTDLSPDKTILFALFVFFWCFLLVCRHDIFYI